MDRIELQPIRKKPILNESDTEEKTLISEPIVAQEKTKNLRKHTLAFALLLCVLILEFLGGV